MVLTLDGNSEHVKQATRKIGLLGEEKIQFVTALDLTDALNTFQMKRLLLTCAPISGLPSDISVTI